MEQPFGKESPETDRGDRIDYRVRTSTRARSVRLTLSPREGLTVVVPHKFDLGRVPAIVEKKRSWIEGHLRRFAEAALAEARSGAGAEAASARRLAAELPETLDLPALGESWRIDYRRTTTRYVGVMVDGPGQLAVYGAVSDYDACREALKGWLRLRTREELVPWLERLARKGGFKFREAQIKGQKTRWASCSSKGTINLSFKLLFLEREWVRCVLMHELCHTVYMNHSPRFWTLLSTFEPECRAIHRKMRDGWKRVPAWVEERAGG
ncbi:MAG: M48 family metallopeptidase [Deltaproteobacteria bacterium]|nr:M48 family metallopeptidase [Deltaproteobacteria bacterium]